MLEELVTPNKVYFQPPENVKLIYPCIIYNRGVVGKTEFANNKPYTHRVRYDVIVIDKNPDSPLLDKIAMLPMCIFQRHYTVDNLNHDIYELYY
jgi:hypothetical protein